MCQIDIKGTLWKNFIKDLRFCDKHSYDYTSEFAKDSYIVADALADAVRKEFYEAFKGDKDERDSTRGKKVAWR